MVKLLLLSGLLSLFFGSAMAQAPNSNLESETFKQRLRAQYLHNDTAQAIVNLYSRRQAGGAGWILSSMLTAVRVAVSGGGSSGYATSGNSGSGAALLVVVPFVAYGVSKMVRYSNGKLEQTLTAYAAGQALPRGTRRKLKPRFFNQPIIQYKAVEAVPTK